MKHTIRTHQTQKGIPVTAIQVSGAQTLEIRLYFKAGFKYFPDYQRHMPHIIEHLVLGQDRGLESVQYLTHNLQRLGAAANGSTDFDNIVFELSAPSHTAQEAAKSVLEMLSSPVLDGDVLEREREIIVREIYERYDSMSGLMTAQLLSDVLAPVMPTDPDAEVAAVYEIEPSEVGKLYRKTMHAGNLRVVAVGDTTPAFEQEFCRMLDEYVAPAPARRSHPRSLIKPPTQPAVYAEDGGSDKNAGCIFVINCGNSEKLSEKDRTAANLAFNLLFGTLDAIVPNALRRLGYVYSANFDQIYYSGELVLIMSLNAEADKLPLAIGEVVALVKRYSQAPFPSDEFENIQAYAKNSLPGMLQTPVDVLNWYESSILTDKPLVDVPGELREIAGLRETDVADALRRSLLNTDWHAGIIAPDASLWGRDLITLVNRWSHEPVDEAGIRTQLSDFIDQIPARRAHRKREWWDNFIWVIFSLLHFAVTLMLIYAPVFATKSKGALSLYGMVTKNEIPAAAAIPLVLLIVAGLLGFLIDRKGAKEADFALAASAAAGYWLLVVPVTHIVSGFWASAAAVLYPLLFSVMIGVIALSRVVMWVSSAQQRKAA